MGTAMIALIAGIAVAVVEQIGAYLRDRANNADKKKDGIDAGQKKILESIQTVSDRVDKLSKHVEDTEARQCRIRILRFDDELTRGVMHSRDHFQQTIEDIDIYQSYCDNHTDFRNGVAEHAMKHIKDVYDRKVEVAGGIQ